MAQKALFHHCYSPEVKVELLVDQGAGFIKQGHLEGDALPPEPSGEGGREKWPKADADADCDAVTQDALAVTEADALREGVDEGGSVNDHVLAVDTNTDDVTVGECVAVDDTDPDADTLTLLDPDTEAATAELAGDCDLLLDDSSDNIAVCVTECDAVGDTDADADTLTLPDPDTEAAIAELEGNGVRLLDINTDDDTVTECDAIGDTDTEFDPDGTVSEHDGDLCGC